MNLSKESVREIVDSGCTISLPYKEKIDNWFTNIELCKRGSRYMILGEIYISKKEFDDIWVEFSKFFDNIGMIQYEVVEKTPLLDPDDFEKVKRLVYKRVRELRLKGISHGRKKKYPKQRKNILHGGRSSQLKKVEEWYKKRRVSHSRRLK